MASMGDLLGGEGCGGGRGGQGRGYTSDFGRGSLGGRASQAFPDMLSPCTEIRDTCPL